MSAFVLIFRATRSTLLLTFAFVVGNLAIAQNIFPQREQITLDIAITAASDVNPDEKERARPLLVRFYELRSSANFETADYFSLHSGDRAVIGTDLLSREEFVVRPGEQRNIRRKSHPDIEAIAVIAGYQDLATSDWRTTYHVVSAPEAAWYRALMPAKKIKLTFRLQRHGIQVIHVD